MTRPTGKPKGRPKNMFPKESVVGNSKSAQKANNQLLKQHGVRKCKQCREIFPLSEFKILRYRVASPTNNVVIPVYSMTCSRCKELNHDTK